MVQKSEHGQNTLQRAHGVPSMRKQSLGYRPDQPDTNYLSHHRHRECRTCGNGDHTVCADGSIIGDIVDWWRTALDGVGPAGVYKGKGERLVFCHLETLGRAPEGSRR